MKLPKELNEIVKKIDWIETVKVVMPIFQPFIQGVLWYGFTNFDKRAQALSRFIAIAEVIPAVDLNLPKGVVLASMYDGVEDALAIWSTLVETLQDIPDAVKDIVKETKEDIIEIIPTKEDIVEEILPDEIDKVKFLADYGDCLNGYNRDTPGYLKNDYTKQIYIQGCLIRKGYALKIIKQAIRDFLL